MKVNIRYALGELKFVMECETPTEQALIAAIRDKEPKVEWTNKSLMPGNPAWARFSLNVNGRPLAKAVGK